MMWQRELLPPDHDSLQQDRLQKFGHTNPERVYAAAWKRLNHRQLSTGATYLEHILCPSGKTPHAVSRRDAVVAASVIQWLGTNCGMGFIWDCERRIDGLRHREYDRPSLHAVKRGDYDVAPKRGIALKGIPTDATP